LKGLRKLRFQFRQFPRETLGDCQNRPKVSDQFPMAEPEGLLGSTNISLPRERILKNCETFQDSPDLFKFSSPIRLAVDEETLRTFLAALDGTTSEFTTANLNGLFGLRGVRVCIAFVACFGIPVAARS
jgi:hypothetical protein